MTKLSLVGMQLPEKYKENFEVSSASSGVTELFGCLHDSKKRNFKRQLK